MMIKKAKFKFKYRKDAEGHYHWSATRYDKDYSANFKSSRGFSTKIYCYNNFIAFCHNNGLSSKNYQLQSVNAR
jgi:hypothetical protein